MRFLLSCLLLLAPPLYAVDPQAVNVRQVFVPNGFDDNDEVEVVVDGYLPNSCHKLAGHNVAVDDATKTIRIVQEARVQPDALCLAVLVPFTNTIHIGVLQLGNYQVIANEGGLTREMLVKESSNAGPDDLTYAAVEAVDVTYDVPSQKYVAELSGRMTNTCMRLGEVTLQNSGLTLEIMPTVTMTEDGACTDADVKFRFSRPLPDLQRGRYLLHVRSMNGRSVNRVFTALDPGDPIH